jgi:hypothetical protein
MPPEWDGGQTLLRRAGGTVHAADDVHGLADQSGKIVGAESFGLWMGGSEGGHFAAKTGYESAEGRRTFPQGLKPGFLVL